MSGYQPRGSSNGSSSGLSAGLRTPPPGIRSPANGYNSIDRNLSPRPAKAKADNSSNTLCRNITIYGFCRYQERGCVFNHDSNLPKLASPALSSSSLASPPPRVAHINYQTSDEMSTQRKLNVQSAAFTPGQSPSFSHATMSSPPTNRSRADAPIFVPRMSSAAAGGWRSPRNQFSEPPLIDPRPLGTATPPVSTTPLPPHTNLMNEWSSNNNYIPNGTTTYDNLSHNFNGLSMEPTSNGQFDHYGTMATQASASYVQPSHGSENYYNAYPPAPPSHHYVPQGVPKHGLASYEKTINDYTMPTDLWEELLQANVTRNQAGNTSLTVFDWCNLLSLDQAGTRVGLPVGSKSLTGQSAWVYKVLNNLTNKTQAMLRLPNYASSESTAATKIAETWRGIKHANMVGVHYAFTTDLWEDNSLCIICDFYPNAETLFHAELERRRIHAKDKIQENIIMDYAVQLIMVLKALHEKDLAARHLDPTKILLTSRSKNTIRLGFMCVLDILQYPDEVSMLELQQADWVLLGKLLLILACSNLKAPASLQASLSVVSSRYSSTLSDLIKYLLNGQPKSFKDVFPFVVDEFARCYDAREKTIDEYQGYLGMELENARFARLMTKMMAVLDRPELGSEEMSNKKLLAAFRDYVFHQVDSQGMPVLDMEHAMLSLNKLDAGTEEKIVLTSPNGQTEAKVPYKILKGVLEQSFMELFPSVG